jgi:MerR family copper efflux transcriptional regulator
MSATIGEAAKQAGLPAKTIRYYEDIGLVRPSGRSAGGYRLYDARDVRTLQFIQRARELGFSVKEVRELLALWQNRQRSSADVKAVAQAHIADIDRRMAELQGMRDTLAHLVEQCHGDHRPECPILADLAGGETDSPSETDDDADR